MSEQYKISIVIPVYKVEKYIDRCINSVFKQKYLNWEAILVDDGSPDNCPQICDKYAKKDSRIKVIHQENKGLSSARNAGMRAITGDILMFLDSDDWLDERAFEYVSKYWTANMDMLIFDYCEAYDNGKNIRRKCVSQETIDFQNDPLYSMEWLERAVNYLHREEPYSSSIGAVWKTAYNVKSITKEEICFPEETQLLEDKVFTLNCLAHFKNVHYISIPIYYWYHNTQSLSYMSYSQNIDKVFPIMDKLGEYVKNIQHDSIEKHVRICAHYKYVVIIALMCKIAFDRNRKFVILGREYCRKMAKEIIASKTKDFSFVDKVVIMMCNLKLTFPIEIALRIRGWTKINLLKRR